MQVNHSRPQNCSPLATPFTLTTIHAPSLVHTHALFKRLQFLATAIFLGRNPLSPRPQPYTCSTFKLFLLDPERTSSITSRHPALLSNKEQLERLFFLSPSPTASPPESQLPHSTSFVVLPLVEEESGRPRPTPSLGFAPFKPP